MVIFYFYFFSSSSNNSFCFVTQEGGLINSGDQKLTSMFIIQNNDRHLAKLLSAVEYNSNIDPVNTN